MQGVCLYRSPPQSTIPHFNDYGWSDLASGTAKNCGGLFPDYVPLPDGTPCGGYLTKQTDGGFYQNAIGYTCRTATFSASAGGVETAHLCMPPTTSGLGTCTTDNLGGLPLYSAVGGVPNAAWLEAATQAGGGTPYYVAFKTACQAAYAWQYDDIASGFGCTTALSVSDGQTFSGFDVTFCESQTPPGNGGGGGGGAGGDVPDRVAALQIRGHAARLDTSGRGRLAIRGATMLPTSAALQDATVFVTDLLDNVGAAGELVAGGTPALSARKRGRKVAVFETPAGSAPRVKVILRRPQPKSERVKVMIMVRRATIARPSSCSGSGGAASLETGLVIGLGSSDTRAAAITSWRCRHDALRTK